MPTSLPTVDEMLEYANKRMGIEIPELKKSISEYSKKYAKMIRSERLMTWYYMQNELGLKPHTKAVAPTETMTLDLIKKSIVKSNLNTQGYIIRLWSYKNRSDNDAIGFAIMDKTGSMTGFINFDDILEKWKEAKVEIGDFVMFKDLTVNEWGGSKTLRITSITELIKPKKKEIPFILGDLVIPISELKNGQSGMIQITMYNKEENSYIGCPECLSSFKVEDDMPKIKEGQTVKCPKCKTDVCAEKLTWIKGESTDGEENIKIQFSPRIVKRFGRGFFEGSVMNVAGSLSDGMFSVDFVVPVLGGGSSDELKEKFETGKPSMETVKRRIPLLVKSWKSIDEPRLIETCKNLNKMTEEEAKTVIAELVKEKVLSLNNGVYKVVENE